MELVTTQKQGNDVVLVFDKKLGIKPEKEYYLIKKKDGSIILIPTAKDIFKDAKPQEYCDADTDNLVRDYHPEGLEKLD